jgi:drug/metabolite transporter (DMT)-like permease
MIYFYLLKEWGAVRTTSVMYIVPMLAILWDLLFLHLIPSTNELMGILTILVGVALIQWTRKPNIKSTLIEP